MKLHVWNQMEQEQLNPKVGRRAFHGANLTIARLEIKKSAVVPEHHHVNEQVSIVESGALKFFIGGQELIVRGGEALEIPPNVPHGVEALEDTVVVDIFAPGRADWLRGDDAYLRK